MEAIAALPVRFTADAIDELRRLYEREAPGRYLRVGAKGGGCSGLTYVLEFDEQKPNDSVFDIDGIPCVMDKAHGLYLMDMEVHWENGLNNRGFTFTNPNASKTCGCGTSFAV